jgi:heavy metal sensor kinase
MVKQAKRINADHLNERRPITHPRDGLGQLATVFNEALGRLEDAFARLRRFTSDASHELRTPLTALRSVGEVALQEDLTATAYQDVIGSMLEEVDRLVRLVENLLTLTRGDSGKWTVTKQVMDLRKEVDEVVDNLSVLAEEKHQDILVVSKEPVLVDLDATLLRHAVLNLVDNAIRYTPPDGNIRIVVSRNESNTGVLEVIDEGLGIPEEWREMVFERFTRIDKDRAREAGGTGLGLAIAKWAIEANGGRIELESMAGKGSTFRLIFPLHNSKVEI